MLTRAQPPYGDVDDRIRSIAHGLGLITIIWTYDSNDWQFGSNPNITIADVDANYQNLINNATNGTFATVRAACACAYACDGRCVRFCARC